MSEHPPVQEGGSIVLVSAALASHGLPNYAAMSTAKAGVEGEQRFFDCNFELEDLTAVSFTC